MIKNSKTVKHDKKLFKEKFVLKSAHRFAECYFYIKKIRKKNNKIERKN